MYRNTNRILLKGRLNPRVTSVVGMYPTVLLTTIKYTGLNKITKNKTNFVICLLQNGLSNYKLQGKLQN